MSTILAEESAAKCEMPDEPSGLRERQRLARDKAILDAAFALMVEQGYDALTMDAVATRVGISRQTLYNYFESRDAIVLRALLTLSEESMAAISSMAADHSLSPLERLRRIAGWMIESKAEPARAALAKVKQSLTVVLTHPDYQAAFARRAASLAEIAVEAQSAGELRADLPPDLIAQMLLSMVSAACASPLPMPAGSAVSQSQIAGAMIDVFFAGLRP